VLTTSNDENEYAWLLSAATAAVALIRGAHPYSLSNTAIGLFWRYWLSRCPLLSANTDRIVPTGNAFVSDAAAPNSRSFQVLVRAYPYQATDADRYAGIGKAVGW